jgi:hypothetical protein
MCGTEVSCLDYSLGTSKEATLLLEGSVAANKTGLPYVRLSWRAADTNTYASQSIRSGTCGGRYALVSDKDAPRPQLYLITLFAECPAPTLLVAAPTSIYGCTPLDPMHSLQHGLIWCISSRKSLIISPSPRRVLSIASSSCPSKDRATV